MEFSSRAISETIRQIRLEKGLSQEVLSGLADIGRSHLAMIETGKKKANMETIWKIAAALDMKPSEFLHQVERCMEAQGKKRNANLQ